MWTIFMIFFGYPSYMSYYKKKTFFVESHRCFSPEDLPVISVSKIPTDDVDADIINSACLNKTMLGSENINACISRLTSDVNETIIDLRENFYFGQNSSVDKALWKTTFNRNYYGRTFFLQDYNLSDKDYMKLVLAGSKDYTVNLHDRKYYVENTEKFSDYTWLQKFLHKGQRVSLFLEITLINLLPEVSGCNSDQDYNFLQCTKVSSSPFISSNVNCKYCRPGLAKMSLGVDIS